MVRVKVKDWPLSREIRLIMLKSCFVPKATQHFLQLVRKKVLEAQLLEAWAVALAPSQLP